VNSSPNPFPGLRPFEFDENYVFFGRDGQSSELLRRLGANRFVAIAGTSSSGKSSLVRAGLLPALFGGMMAEAGSSWRVAILRPGANPLQNLAYALNAPDVLGDALQDDRIQIALAEATLRRTSLGLVDLVRQARMQPHENLLIVVDQFEELFRYVSLKDEREEDAAVFVALLLAAVQQRNFPVYVVLTLRSDFLGDCARFWQLSEALNSGLYLVPRLTREEYREAIMGPVAVGKSHITQPLVNRLLNDMGDNPDQLPILQHALMRTWDYWQGREPDDGPLGLSHYDAVGGMANALALHAEEAFAELPGEPSRRIAEIMFKALTERGSDNRLYRRPMQLGESSMIAEAKVEDMAAVAEVFRREGRSFIMPPVGVPLRSDTVLDIAHESLIRNWPRLVGWVEEEVNSAKIYLRLAENARLYRMGSAALLRDPELQLALDWRDRQRPNAAWASEYDSDFESAMAFLDESSRAHEHELAERERSRLKRLKRTRIIAFALAAMALISMVLAFYTYRLRAVSEARRVEAETQRREALRLSEQMKLIAEEKAMEAAQAKDNQQKAEAGQAKAKADSRPMKR
jgi:hypothetical protein